MKKGLLTIGIIRNLREVKGICPVCGGPLKINYRTGWPGQWAHFIRDTKGHVKRYGPDVIGSKYNGIMVCGLECNNAVQLSYCSQPVLCDELADYIVSRMADDKLKLSDYREVVRCG